MVLYLTKQTRERYNVKIAPLPDPVIQSMKDKMMQEEQGNRLLEWGVKIFYFDGKKSLQLVNFASKLTLFLFDIKMSSFPKIGELIIDYLFFIYKGDKEMEAALDKMLSAHAMIGLEKLTDRKTIATLNRNQIEIADDYFFFSKFLRDGILYTRELNRSVNFGRVYPFEINGKKQYMYSGVIFRELMLKEYGK